MLLEIKLERNDVEDCSNHFMYLGRYQRIIRALVDTTLCPDGVVAGEAGVNKLSFP